MEFKFRMIGKLSIISFLLLFIHCDYFENRGNENDPKSHNYIGDNIIIDHDDGTIYDSATKLYWRKCSQGQSDYLCTGAAAEYKYCDSNGNSCNGSVTGGILDGSGNSEAYDACEVLNNGGFAEITDWRVPTFPELDNFYENVYLKKIEFFPNTPEGYYWSSSSHEDNPNYAYGIDFENGQYGMYSKLFADYIRCVSGP